MEMEVLYTYKNQLLACDGYTCVMSTCQKVEWSCAFISASCLNLRTVKCPLFLNPPITVALVRATTALLLYRGAATFTSWRVAAACDYWKKNTKQKQHSRAMIWTGSVSTALCCHGHRIRLSTSSSPPQWLLISSKSPWCLQIHDRRGIIITKRASSFLLANWTQPEKKKSAPWFAAWFLHQHLSDVICHFAVHSVVKRALETQYSNRYF